MKTIKKKARGELKSCVDRHMCRTVLSNIVISASHTLESLHAWFFYSTICFVEINIVTPYVAL